MAWWQVCLTVIGGGVAFCLILVGLYLVWIGIQGLIDSLSSLRCEKCGELSMSKARVDVLERRIAALGIVSVNRAGRVRITRTLTAGDEIETGLAQPDPSKGRVTL